VSRLEQRAKTLLDLPQIRARFGLSRKGQHMLAAVILRTEPAEPDRNGALILRMSYNGDHALTLFSGVYTPIVGTLTINPNSILKIVFRNSDVWPVFEQCVDRCVYSFQGHFQEVTRIHDRFRALTTSRDNLYALIGVMRGHDVLTATQANETYKQLKAARQDGEPLTLYSLFQCAQVAVMKHHTAGDAPERLRDLLTFATFTAKNVNKYQEPFK
jgi:hypothetical protein